MEADNSEKGKSFKKVAMKWLVFFSHLSFNELRLKKKKKILLQIKNTICT